MRNLSLLASAATIALAGCATSAVRSIPIPPGKVAPSGISYSLPLARIEVIPSIGVDDQLVAQGLKAKTGRVFAGPDPAAHFVLQYQPSGTSDDEICIGRTEDGVLTEVRFVGAEHTDDLIVTLAATASALTAGVPGKSTKEFRTTAEEAARPVDWANLNWVALPAVAFNPFDAREVNAAQGQIDDEVREALSAKGAKAAPALRDALRHSPLISFTLDDQQLGVQSGPPCASMPNLKAAYGIYYRDTRSMIFVAAPVIGPRATSIAPLADVCSAGFLDVSRAAGVRKSTEIKFAGNGTPQEYKVNKPSEFLAFAGLPLRVIGAVIETPAQFFAAIARANQSEAKAIQARANLILAQAQLEKFRQGQSEQPPNGESPNGQAPRISPADEPKTAFASGLTCFAGGGGGGH